MDVRDGRDPARNKHCASGQGDLNTQINDLIESRKVVLFLDFSLQINIWVWNCFFICKFTLFQYFSVKTLRFLPSFSAIVCWVMKLNMFYKTTKVEKWTLFKYFPSGYRSSNHRVYYHMLYHCASTASLIYNLKGI